MEEPSFIRFIYLNNSFILYFLFLLDIISIEVNEFQLLCQRLVESLGMNKGEETRNFPASLKVLAQCEPVYEEVPGWTEDISGLKKFEDLPENARNYLKRIEELAQTPVEIVSVGPGRDETIVLKNHFV